MVQEFEIFASNKSFFHQAHIVSDNGHWWPHNAMIRISHALYSIEEDI